MRDLFNSLFFRPANGMRPSRRDMGKRQQLLPNAGLYLAAILLMRFRTILERQFMRIIIAHTLDLLSFRPILERQFMRSQCACSDSDACTNTRTCACANTSTRTCACARANFRTCSRPDFVFLSGKSRLERQFLFAGTAPGSRAVHRKRDIRIT